MGYKETLNKILAKAPEDLTEEELRYVLMKVGYLSDDERSKFKTVLKRNNLTQEEIERYRERRMQVLLDLYFPVESDV